MRTYGLSRQVPWHAVATGESVYVPKVLTGTQYIEDHAELPVRGREGGAVKEMEEGQMEWGERGGLCWGTDRYTVFSYRSICFY